MPIPQEPAYDSVGVIPKITTVRPKSVSVPYGLLNYVPTPVTTTLEKRKIILACLVFTSAIPGFGLFVATPGSLAQSIFLYATICSAVVSAMFALDWLNPQWYRSIPPAKLKHEHANFLGKAGALACFSLSFLAGLFWFVNNTYHLVPSQLMSPVLAVAAQFDLDKALYQATEQYNFAVRKNNTHEFRNYRENLLLMADKLPNPHTETNRWSGLPPAVVSLTLSPSKTVTEAQLKKLISWEINRQRYQGVRVTPMWSELATELSHQGRSNEAESIFYATFAQNHGAYFGTIPQVALELSLSLLDTEDARILRNRLTPLQRDQDAVINMVPKVYKASTGLNSNESIMVNFRELMSLLLENPKRAAHLPWTAEFSKDQKHQDAWQSIERVREAFGGVNNISGYDRNGIYSPILKGAIYMDNSKDGIDVINPYAFVARDLVQIKRSDWTYLTEGQKASGIQLHGGGTWIPN